MPFINDRIGQYQQQLAQENHPAKPARQSRFRFEPTVIMASLHHRIVGQQALLQAMEDMLLTLKADFNSAQRPLAVNLFLGPTGVGKTETVRVLAEAMLGSADRICRIDMNTLAQAHYAAALTGSPPGYVGSKEGQSLFNAEHIKGSFSEPGIVLFDEIEKANKEVVRAMLNILDTGKLVLTSGARELDFSNCLIFMTSNIGTRDLTQAIAAHQRGWRRWLGLQPQSESKILDQALTEHFDPEFLNRIDRIIPFNRLSKDQRQNLIHIELEKLNRRLGQRNASIALEQSAIQYLGTNYDERYGARSIARCMRLELEPKLARSLLDHPDQRSFIGSVKNNLLIVAPRKS